MTLFEFLNGQSGMRLIGYSIVFIVSTRYLLQFLFYVSKAMFRRKE